MSDNALDEEYIWGITRSSPMIRMFHVNMPENLDKYLPKTLYSGYVGQGPRVDEFETKFSRLFGIGNAVSVNSGTSALTLALRLAGVGPGDEVVTTAMTCTATNLPILAAGATPVFADVDPVTGLIRPENLPITPRTKAIMAVDWGGQPVDVKALNTYGLPVIVDAAHALGADHNDQPSYLCYSFQAIKHLTTGDGGMLVCKYDEDYERAKKLRWFGIDRTGEDSRIDQDITEWGYKFHMNDIAATIGIAGLDDTWRVIADHGVNAKFYDSGLSPYFVRPDFDVACPYWLYTILLPNEPSRDHFIDYMHKNRIEVSRVHRRNDDYSVFKPYAKRLPGLDEFSKRMVCIPVHSALTLTNLHKIVDTCNEFARGR